MALAYGLASAAHVRATHDRAASSHKGVVDADTKPGDDFFLRTDGGWRKVTEMPVGNGPWGVCSEIAGRARQHVAKAKLRDDANTAPRDSTAHKVAISRSYATYEASADKHSVDIHS